MLHLRVSKIKFELYASHLDLAGGRGFIGVGHFLFVVVFLISCNHVTMQYLYFLRCCRSLYGVSMVDAPGSCLGLVQLMSRLATSACLGSFFLLARQQ